MDLWNAIGITPGAGLVAAGLGLVAALVMAGTIVFRRSRHSEVRGLGLEDHQR
jgi:hypothetical protein